MPTESRHLLIPLRKDKISKWKPAAAHLQVKQYTDYATYIDEQQSKLDGRPGWCAKQSRTLRERLLDWLPSLNILTGGMSVLCLGARLGGEVQAFIELGCYAVGIDLNPGETNPYVLHGDFHHIQFSDISIDLIYCNCIDHVQDIEVFLSEIHRLLKPDAMLLVQAKCGTSERGGSDHWDCLEWDAAKNLGAYIEQRGFKLERNGIERIFRGIPHWFIYIKG
jgi:SAM-dependent methyltransferase